MFCIKYETDFARGLLFVQKRVYMVAPKGNRSRMNRMWKYAAIFKNVNYGS